MSGPVLGIDLGTTNTAVAVADGGDVQVLRDEHGKSLIPSVVSFPADGRVLAGAAAQQARLVDARNTIFSVKRLIGRPFRSDVVRLAAERLPFELREGPTGGVMVAARGEAYALSEISAFVLQEARRIAERATGSTCDSAVVTVPANFNELQRSATKAAGRVAGLEVRRILNEPTAAALAYGYGRGGNERVAVYDFGGGTFDITVIELSGQVFEVVATAGDTFLGGDDIDTLVLDKMLEAFAEQHNHDVGYDPRAVERLRVAAEWAKCQLSAQSKVHVRVEEVAYGSDGLPRDLSFELTRAQLDDLAMPLVERTLAVCEDVFAAASLRPSQLDNVILVGGSSRMGLVRKQVEDFFQRPPLARVDPELVVAQGAALQGFALKRPSELPPASSKPPSLRPLNDDELEEIRQSVVPPAPGPRVPPPPPVGLSIQGVPVAEHAPPKPTPHADQTGQAMPLLVDVTPLSLGIETVSGYCEHLIPRNSAVPTEHSRTFTTASDNQTEVRVNVCQGESRRLEENQQLGEIALTGLRTAPRGKVHIKVTFVIDADGTLGVQALDLATGQKQSVRINLLGGVSREDIDQMQQRHRRMASL